MKYHALYVIFEKEAKFEFVVCCKLYVGLYGLILFPALMTIIVVCSLIFFMFFDGLLSFHIIYIFDLSEDAHHFIS